MDSSQKDFSTAFASTVQKTSRMNKPTQKKWIRVAMIAAGVLATFILIAVIAGFFVARSLMALRTDIDATTLVAKEAYDALKTQNLPLTDEKLSKLEMHTKQLQTKVTAYSWTKPLPVIGAYYRDSEHAFQAGFAGLSAAQKLVKEIEPYADVLGFKGQGSFNGGTAEERLAKILETLQKVSPAIDSISGDLKTVNDELSQIDERRYPESFKGKQVRSKITQAKSVTHDAYTFISENRQAVELLPEMAGATKRKKYLVLFQNSGELRPTGGFLTAYAVINIDKGKVQPEGSGDIYELDQRFTNKPPIPAILKKYLTSETKWNLRDMNLSPDFKQSMMTFNQSYQTIKGQKAEFDGIITVDTHFLESLLKVIGPVSVPAYGTFTAENDPHCDCPQIIYALSEIIDRPTNYVRTDRKGILGPMMSAILQKSYSAPKNIWPQLFQVGWGNVEAKHVQMYFLDPKLQAAAESINAAGIVKPTPEGSDYFLIVDANLAGAKSNFFVQSEVDHVIDIPQNGTLKHTVTVNYKNPFKPSNCNLEAGELCMNGKLNDWVRVYLPKSTKMVSTRGFDEGSVKESEDLDHHVIEGVFQLQPLSQAKIELVYEVPYTDPKNYNLLIQKQGGTENWKYTFDVNSETHELNLDKDKKLTFPF